MLTLKRVRARLSFIKKYHYRLVFIIAAFWTAIDLIYWVRVAHLSGALQNDYTFQYISKGTILLRAIIVFSMSGIMGYLLIFRLRQVFRNYPLFVNLLAKTTILLSAALIMNFLLHITYSVFIMHLSLPSGLQRFFGHAASVAWLVQHSFGWVLLFLLTQIIIEVNEKYSPGIFWAILIGKYIQPKIEKRIVMFIDLNDSTSIAERLGSTDNFKFIRDFIYYVSVALMEYDGRIYQYVGDEIVVSWLYKPKNVHKCLSALVLSDRLLRRKSGYFKGRYGVLPEFKVGIHAGEITVGEIGLIKKDIAMSGDTMNTAARICNSSTELGNKYIASKEFLDSITINWESESMGMVDLKGKSDSMELFALKI